LKKARKNFFNSGAGVLPVGSLGGACGDGLHFVLPILWFIWSLRKSWMPACAGMTGYCVQRENLKKHTRIN
jgi:hypothetical protein